jgi:autotransporter family porin
MFTHTITIVVAVAVVVSLWTPDSARATGERDEQIRASTLDDGYFETLPPRATLPSDVQCAELVRPAGERKPLNTPFNYTVVTQTLAADFFKQSNPKANTDIAARVTGNFTGTTDEILQWIACKWGVDEDVVRAQAATESTWRQYAMGDWSTRAKRCAPDHGLGVDGRSGLCPESWGILQVKYYFYPSTWPGIATSTAFNADVAFAIWRACYEGYETWLGVAEHGSDYKAGDLWGCIGRWYAGKWHTPNAEFYIGIVKRKLDNKVWLSRNF